MIEEQFVSFDTAKSLKEAGFNVECDWFYINDGSVDTGIVVRSTSPRDHNMGTDFLSRPTQALAARWLRETHTIDIAIGVVNAQFYYARLYQRSYLVDMNTIFKPTYEEALETGLQKAIKLIKK